MLQHQGCDPHVVRRDRRALLTQLPVNSGVVVRRLLISIEHAHSGLQEKPAQDGFVTRSLVPHGKSGAQLSRHDERQPDFIGELDHLDNGYIAPAKVGVTVCVERQLHFHISSSMVSCASRALSKAGSLCQVPAISLRSRCLLRSPATPAPRARASMATSFRLLPCSRAARRRASSKVSGTLRMVYCMQIL